MQVDWTAETVGGVTLVHLQVRNDGRTDRRVRVTNQLDGPVWFPRQAGRAEATWDDLGFEGVIEAGETRPLGYASPAAPTDPPATVEDVGPARDRSGTTPAEVVCDLGDPRPPRDAVRAGDPGQSTGSDDSVARETPESDGPDADDRSAAAPDENPASGGVSRDPSLPTEVAAWLDEVDRRAARFETGDRVDRRRVVVDRAALSSAVERIAGIQGRLAACDSPDASNRPAPAPGVDDAGGEREP